MTDPKPNAPLTMSAAYEARSRHGNYCWTGSDRELLAELDATRAALAARDAEVARLTAGLESIVTLCTVPPHDGIEESYSPGGSQAWIILQGSDRPLERERVKLAAHVEALAVARDALEGAARAAYVPTTRKYACCECGRHPGEPHDDECSIAAALARIDALGGGK